MPEIEFRPMTADDIGRVPMDCHGGAEALGARIEDLGSAAILAFDGGQHVGQLQFRRHDAALRSATGLMSPDYWGDFGDGQLALPAQTLGVFCYHVGQLHDGTDREARYQGRGIGVGLLDYFLAWATAKRFEAVVAKSVPSHQSVMRFMGGQPSKIYTDRGFEVVKTWFDAQLHETVLRKNLADAAANPGSVADVGMCVRRLTGP